MRIEDLVNSLGDMIDRAEYFAGKAEKPLCRCQEDYICSYCRAKKVLAEAEGQMVEGVFKVKRPRRRIRCITTGQEFNTLKEASEKYGIVSATISKCLKGELKVAGKLGQVKLEWEYMD